MQPNPNKKQKQEVFKSMFKSSIRASYFNHLQDNHATSRSRIQIEEIQEEEEVDENTFRIMPGFVKPDDTYQVYYKKGRLYLEKEGFFSCLASRRRYDVELHNFKLKISRAEGAIDQFFNFDTEAVEVTNKGGFFTLRVEKCDKTFYFEPVEEHSKEQIVDDWVSLLKKAIDAGDGKKKHYSYLVNKNEMTFFTQQHVSYQDFQKSCNSLDIILFKSQHSAAAIQRTFTGSEYDHVGIVLRNKKNQIFIFESSSGEGVGLTPWKHVIRFGWYDSTDKISWRRMHINLSGKDIMTIEAFVAKTLGKEFEISLDKLFTFSSVLHRSEDDDKNKTYFCSELAARLYKELGLLDQSKSSTQYYPVDFSDKVKINITRPGTYLEHERVIAFNR